MSLVLAVIAWAQAHPYFFWLLLSAAVNLALRKRTAREWVALCAKHPRGAAVIKLFEAFGVDTAKAIDAFQLLINAKAAQSSATAAGITEVLSSHKPTDQPPTEPGQ